MRVIRVFAVAAVLTGSMVSSSCSLIHRSKGTARTARTPQPVLVMPPAPAAPRVQIVSVLPPPELAPQEPGTWMPPPTDDRFPPAPRPPRRARLRENATEIPVSTQPEASTEPAAQLPQLEQILSAEQQQAYNDEIDRNIARAQRTVSILNGRRLSNEQKTYLDRIRTFLQQASEARKTDLFRARNLAERASVLADDLAKSLQ